MSRGRRCVVHALIVVVLGGHVASLLFNTQIWPYSPYAMYADDGENQPRTFQTLVLVGEPVAGDEFWFESQGYLTTVISPMIISSVFSPVRTLGAERIQRQLRDTYEFYERRRSHGLIDAPPLRRIALYRFTWKLQPDLANVRSPVRALIATYAPDDRVTR
jgi:hypothetical protein